jgi:transcription initiation factor TFIID subunit TAF12
MELPTRKFFAPLKTAGMELESAENTNDQADGDQQQPPSSQRGRSPPITQLQNHLKASSSADLSPETQEPGSELLLKEWP